MSGADPSQKHPRPMIWFLGILVLVVVGTMLRDKPINIAASDNPPSISTPIDRFNEANATIHERRTKIGEKTPLAQPIVLRRMDRASNDRWPSRPWCPELASSAQRGSLFRIAQPERGTSGPCRVAIRC
jgi:hypothetical protein